MNVTAGQIAVHDITRVRRHHHVRDATEDLKRYGPNTPSYARFRQRIDYGSAWTFGVKGSW